MFRLTFAALLFAAPAFAAEPTHQVKLNGQTFTLPEGFEIEVAAGADMAPRPIVAAFDEKGRLYVCDSSGSNEKPSIQVEKKPHRIVRLESTKGDGKFDKQTVFVKNVMFPEGCMFFNGSLYVAAPPQIWKFTDTDDDGVADKAEVWFDGKTLTGCANDLHGPYRGPDGYIYWCKGAFAKQEYTLPNGKKFTTRASHIFRAKPDGTGIEPVMTGGMDNPVGVAFTPGGDIIFSTTFLQNPANGKRDGLIHAVYGAVYGKDHDVVYEHPWTSPTLMPPMTHLGPAAPCGLHRYESDQFGKEYENNLFCCQFNMRKVSRHILVPSGSTYVTKDSDFVVSDSLDFHPTDVIEDADGSLLIVDTGGWYKLCCPTSQLVKPDVSGAIYRVKKTGAHKVADPRGLKIEWAKLKAREIAQLMGDPRPVVSNRAVDILATGDEKAGEELSVIHFIPFTPKKAELNSIWAVTRREGIRARWDVELALRLPDEEMRIAAAHSLGLWRHAKAEPPFNQLSPLCKIVVKDTPRVRRAAAEALGRIGDPKAIPYLLDSLVDEKNDRVLDHALTYALIEIGDAEQTAAGLKHKSPRIRRACLAALENIPDSGLDAKTVFPSLGSEDTALRETAWWIAGRHPQWGDQLAGYFKNQLAQIEKLAPAEQEELAGRAVPFLKTVAISQAIGEAIKSHPNRAILHAMARSKLKALPAEWKDGVQAALLSQDIAVARDAIAVLRVAEPSSAQYSSIAESVKTKLPLEIDYALQALWDAPLGEEEAEAVIASLHRDKDAPTRAAAAELLALNSHYPATMIELTAALKTMNPLERGRILPAFAKSTDEKVGLALVKALRDPAVRPSIRAEIVKPILDKYPKAVQVEAEKLYAELAEARKGERAKLEKMLAELKPGDIRRGQLVFNNAKTQCIACHKVGYVGGTIGPDLTKVGATRSERDLLESIVFPSASFVRSYEPVRVLTTDERTFNGILKKDAPDEIIVVVAANKEERIARADVASISPSSVSLMPAGLDQQLSAQDLADLVAFLKACK